VYNQITKHVNYDKTFITIIILGDFNLPKIYWTSYTGGGHEVYDIFLRFVIETGYYQLVTHSTRDSSILDLILTNDPSLFTAVDNDVPFGSSNHSAVKFDMVLGGHSCVPPSLSSSSPIKYKWFSGDYEAIESYLFTFDWYFVLQLNPSAEAAWDAFMSILYYVIDRHVPRLNCTNSRPQHYWRLSRAISKCTAKKRRLWRHLKRHPYDSSAHAKYHECVHQWRRLIQQYKASAEENVIKANDVGAFYRFVNMRVSNRSKITAVTDQKGVALTNDTDIANAFNDYFSSVGVQSNNITPQFTALDAPRLTTINVGTQDVLAAVNKLKGNLSSGPDGLPPLFFKR